MNKVQDDIICAMDDVRGDVLGPPSLIKVLKIRQDKIRRFIYRNYDNKQHMQWYALDRL